MNLWEIRKFLSRGMKVSISSSLSPSGSFEESHDTEKIELIIKSVANEDWLAGSFHPVMMEVKVVRTTGRSRHPGETKRSLSHSGRTGDA